LAGPKALVQKVIPYTKGVMGKGYLDFSDQDYGNASILKVLGNSVIFAAVEGLAEGLTLAEKSGVGVDALVQFVDNMFPGS
jgi:3-hydroxyisobutyrate dehydrogenase-like beta-hydroxyacid dehydrogenase